MEESKEQYWFSFSRFISATSNRAVSDEEQESEVDASQPHGAWRLLYAPTQHFDIGFSQLSVRLSRKVLGFLNTCLILDINT